MALTIDIESDSQSNFFYFVKMKIACNHQDCTMFKIYVFDHSNFNRVRMSTIFKEKFKT